MVSKFIKKKKNNKKKTVTIICSVQLPREDGQLSHDAQTNLDPVKVGKSVPDDDG